MKKKDHFEQITLLKKKYQFKNYSHKFAGFVTGIFFWVFVKSLLLV